MAREKVLEKKIREQIKKIGGLALKWESQVFTGMPDRIILLPGGRVIFAEIKTTGKRPTGRQLSVHDRLRRLGFDVWVVDSEQVLNEMMENIQNVG